MSGKKKQGTVDRTGFHDDQVRLFESEIFEETKIVIVQQQPMRHGRRWEAVELLSGLRSKLYSPVHRCEAPRERWMIIIKRL